MKETDLKFVSYFLHQTNVYKIKIIIKYKSMRKILTLIIILLTCSVNISNASDDLWDNYGDSNFYGNKGAISDKDFEKALATRKGQKKPKKVKGETYHQSNETEVINQKAEELPVVCINTSVKISDDAVLPVGHYQVISEKRNGKIFLKLYQGHYLMAEFEAYETLDDFDQPEINFADFITDGNIYKLIFGSIDYNAYVNLEQADVQSE